MTTPLLCEVNARCWLADLSIKADSPVHLGNVPEEEFRNWAQAGFTHIWLMGVWSTGTKARETALKQPWLRKWAESNYGPGFNASKVLDASPYAISGYNVAPDLGGEAGLSHFKSKLNSFGIKLVLDFIPNHTGLDHPWLHKRPELFVRAEHGFPGTFKPDHTNDCRVAHGKDPYFAPWTDTAQLDYRSAKTHVAMTEELQRVARRCDGVRCDMAMLVMKDVFFRNWSGFPDAESSCPAEFWPKAIASVKLRFPEFLFLAEVYWGLELALQDMGFDYTYDKVLYDALISENAVSARRHLYSQPTAVLNRAAHFLENHDEKRAASALSTHRHCAAAMLILALPGMRLIHEHQFDGWRIHSPVQVVRRPIEATDPAIREIYEQAQRALEKTRADANRQLLEPLDGSTGKESSVVIAISPNGTSHPTIVSVNLGDMPARIRLNGVPTPQSVGHTKGARIESTTDEVVLDLPACSWLAFQRQR